MEREDLKKAIASTDLSGLLEMATTLLDRQENPSSLAILCDAIVEGSRATWWRCDCGPISPTSGLIDVICPRCGARRILPDRCAGSPWRVYVKLLERCIGASWFDVLAKWMVEQNLGEVGILHADPQRRESMGNGAYPQDSDVGGSGVLPTAIAARGGTSPAHRALFCIDGMRILETREVRGAQWIALPMMPVSFFSDFLD